MRLIVIIYFTMLTFSATLSAEGIEGPTEKARFESSFGKLPVYFIENQGQIDDESVRYYVKGADKTLYFTGKGITFSFTGSDDNQPERWNVMLEFVKANPMVQPRGEEKQKTVISYFKGKKEDWKTGMSTFTRLVYQDLWPGIDLIYAGTVNELKYEFVVKPGADPNQIRLAYRGADEVCLKETGELCVLTPLGGFEDGIPYAYQLIDGEEEEVSMSYLLEPDHGENQRDFSFKIGSYDYTKPLVLDPLMRVYCGYIEGNDSERSVAIAVDNQGHAFVTGDTNSNESFFPVIEGPDLSYNGGDSDVFVAKVSPDGSGLVFCGYIGGSEYDLAFDLALDSQGDVYVTGETASSESLGFPVTGGPNLTFSGDSDGFVAKVTSDGLGLVYCGYIGGTSREESHGIAVDAQGCAYITGWTWSSWGFPLLIGPDLNFKGGRDAFIAKVDSDGSGFIYSGFIGGKEDDAAFGIAVDSQGCAYVTGYTESDEDWDDFPVCIGPDLTHNGSYFEDSTEDCFVAKVNANGSNLIYCGYIGGSCTDIGVNIAVDEAGCSYIAGRTNSDEVIRGFPTVVGPDLTYNGAYDDDAFIAKVTADGVGLVYCGYIGGSDNDMGMDVAVDGAGCAYLTGVTGSDQASEGFPIIMGPDLTHNGNDDVFIAKVNSAGTGLDVCGYIGGASDDLGYGIALGEEDEIYITGKTASHESYEGFPVIVGPDLIYDSNNDNAFVVKIIPDPHIIVDDNNTTGPWVGSLDHPFLNIQDGIDAASDNDTILVFPGTYYENFDFTGKALTLRSDLDGVPSTVDIAPESTVIDGGQAGVVIEFGNGEGSDSILEGFTITNGLANNGGGVFCHDQSSPWIGHCIFTFNTGVYNGGGLYAWSSDPILYACEFRENTTPGRGGAIYGFESSFEVIESTFTENEADAGGGGLYINGESAAKITDCRFVNNYSLLVGTAGGAINNGSYTNTLIKSCTFDGNVAEGGGGAIYNYAYSDPVLVNCLFYNNSTNGNGGALNNYAESLVATNCTFTANHAGTFGGAFYNSQCSPVITNCILWNDTSGSPAIVDEIYDAYSAYPTVSHCLVQGGYAGGSDLLDEDPLFIDPLSYNYHLFCTSPCIDVGDNSAPSIPDTDIDGQGRITSSFRGWMNGQWYPCVVDMGVDEYWGPKFSHRPHLSSKIKK